MGHRDELLSAARRLLEQKGYAAITARDLVAESGTNLASIGYHFGSKDALLAAAIEDAFVDWTEQLASVAMADDSLPPLARGVMTWVAVLERLPAQQNLLRAYVDALAQAQRSPVLREQIAAQLVRARGRVAVLVAASMGGGIDPQDPRCTAIAAFVIAVCDGLCLQWLVDPEHTPTGAELLSGLAAVWEVSFPGSTLTPPP